MPDHQAGERELDEFVQGESTEAWSPASILDGIDLDAPPPRPELLDLVYRGKLLLLSGTPESAKTWLALVIVVEAMRASGSVLVLDTDGTGRRDLAARLVGLGLDRELAAEVGYSDDPREWFGTDDARARVAAWVKRMAERGPVVLVIDSANPTVSALGHKLDEAGFTEVEAKVIAPLKRAGAAIVLVDHVAIHAAKDSPYSISTQRKHAAADVHLRLTAGGAALMRGGPPASFLITGPKDRPGGIARRGTARHVGRVTFSPGDGGAVGYAVDLSPPSAEDTKAIFRPTALMERVSRWAPSQVDGFSKRDVESGVEGKAQGLRKAVDVLWSRATWRRPRAAFGTSAGTGRTTIRRPTKGETHPPLRPWKRPRDAGPIIGRRVRPRVPPTTMRVLMVRPTPGDARVPTR